MVLFVLASLDGLMITQRCLECVFYPLEALAVADEATVSMAHVGIASRTIAMVLDRGRIDQTRISAVSLRINSVSDLHMSLLMAVQAAVVLDDVCVTATSVTKIVSVFGVVSAQAV